MKVLPICIVLFILLTVCVYINAGFINKCSEFIDRSAEELKIYGNREKSLNELERFWSKNRNLIGLSVWDDELDRTESIIICLRTAYEENNEYEFEKYRAELKNAAVSIGRKEKLSGGSLF